MSKLDELDEASDEVANQLLLRCLGDDGERALLYREMATTGRTTLQFRSFAYEADSDPGVATDAYLVTAPQDIEYALQHLSVKPYAALGGGQFMLAMDQGPAHRRQRAYADSLLDFSREERAACARHAFRRASTLALKLPRFDLAALAEQVAARYVALLFGFPDEAHGVLYLTIQRLYLELCFQILGRHFTVEQLPPRQEVAPGESLRDWIIDLIEDHNGRHIRRPQGVEGCGEPILARMRRDGGGYDREELSIIVHGLITGAIGNVQASVSIALSEFFNRRVDGRPLLIEAQRAAVDGDDGVLGGLVMNALTRNPPAAFLPRRSDGRSLRLPDGQGGSTLIPEGRDLVLGLGAAERRDLVFGGDCGDAAYVHQCVGQHIAYPLIVYTVKRLLLLPGLAQMVEPPNVEATALSKRMGMICTRYPLQFNRGRRLLQQPLAVVMDVKAPVAEHAEKLGRIIAAGAPAIEEALRASTHVHFAFFQLLLGGRQLALYTVYDGDFDAYIEHFALRVELFDKLFEHLEDAPPTPVRDHPKEFVDTIRRHDRAPVGGYFYSAYSRTSVAQIVRAFPKEPESE